MSRVPRWNSPPPWFSPPEPRPAPLCDTLLTLSVNEWLAEERISGDELSRWEKLGWVRQVDRTLKRTDGDPTLLRLEHLRDIVWSGLPDREITWLLSQLPDEVVANPHSLAYSFRFGWVKPTWMVPPVRYWYEHLAQWMDRAEPAEIRDAIDQLQARLDDLETEQQSDDDIEPSNPTRDT